MTATFYRILAGLSLLAGLSACNRATYSFTSQPAYSAAPVAELAAVADAPAATVELAAGPTLGPRIEVASPVRRARRPALKTRAQLVEQSIELAATQPAIEALPHRHARHTARRHQNTAASGALVPDSAVSGLGQLAIIVAVLFCVVVGAVILFVAKATAKVVEGKSSKSASLSAPRPTP